MLIAKIIEAAGLLWFDPDGVSLEKLGGHAPSRWQLRVGRRKRIT